MVVEMKEAKPFVRFEKRTREDRTETIKAGYYVAQAFDMILIATPGGNAEFEAEVTDDFLAKKHPDFRKAYELGVGESSWDYVLLRIWLIRARTGDRQKATAELEDYEPAFKGGNKFAIRMKDHGHITDPGKYVKDLARHFENQGGTIEIAEVEDFEKSDNAVTAIKTSKRLIK